LLIRYGAWPRPRWPSAESASGSTALQHLFAQYDQGTAPLIRAYLEAGVDPIPDELLAMAELVNSRAFDGNYELAALAIACSTHLDQPGRSGHTLLTHLACFPEVVPGMRKKLIALLAARGADFYAEDDSGRSPLRTAVSYLNRPALEELLAAGADPKRRGESGWTLFHALPYGKEIEEIVPFVERLLALGLDINARDKLGRTALHLAAEAGDDPELMKFLVAKGGNPAIADYDGLTPMGNARSIGLDGLAAYQASLKIPDHVGGWPAGNQAAACRAVLGADLPALAAIPLEQLRATTARTGDGVPATPLHLAAERGNLAVLRALTARKVDWNVGDRYGRTPLEAAVRAGRPEAVSALLKAGADPAQRGQRGISALTVAIATGSPLTETLLAAARKPEWRPVHFVAAANASSALVRRLSAGSEWTPEEVDLFVKLGRADLIEMLDAQAAGYGRSKEELLAAARDKAGAFLKEEAEWKKPLEGRQLPDSARQRKGSYALRLEAWSPWMPGDPSLDFGKFPLAVHVPEGYDGSRPYGLIISMMNAKSSSQFPKPEYLATLEAHRLLYVGFDPYSGVDEAGSAPDFHTDYERYVLAAAYHMLGAYNVDRGRVYLAGFSKGGRLTGEIMPMHPRLFTGGLAVAGCFTTGGRSLWVHPNAGKRAAMVLATGDWDYNRQETYGCYASFLALGYDAFYLQEPQRAHARISGEYFEKAISFLDEAAAGR
jgi:ankyrin repeat protein